MQKAIIQLETLSCPSCIQKIDKAVRRLSGINPESVSVLFNASKVKVAFDSETISLQAIEEAIEELGYAVIESKAKPA